MGNLPTNFGVSIGRFVLDLSTSALVYISTPAANRQFLKLNEDKTQGIWLGTRQQLSKVTAKTLTLSNATVKVSDVVNDLGVGLIAS